MQGIRRKMQMIFQDPYSSLNPRMTVEQTLGEVLTVHHLCPPGKVNARIQELLHLVGLPADAAQRYPRHFSGGQRQRIGIARALAMEPEFIVADEPVSAVDVSIQAQVLNLLLELKAQLGLTLLFIAHDLSVVQYISTRVGVMYLGKIVEIAPRKALFAQPRHPYTQGLLLAAPQPDPFHRTTRVAIEGEPPSPLRPPPGCRFHNRCYLASARCRSEEPLLQEIGDGQWVACHHHDLASWPPTAARQMNLSIAFVAWFCPCEISAGVCAPYYSGRNLHGTRSVLRLDYFAARSAVRSQAHGAADHRPSVSGCSPQRLDGPAGARPGQARPSERAL